MLLRPISPLLAVILSAAIPAAAQDVREHYKLDVKVHPDGSMAFDVREERTALSTAGARKVSLAMLKSWARENVSAVEAYTQKADGRVVPVPPSDIVSQQGIVAPGFSEPDAQIVQINFRDVEVGDSTVWITRSVEQPLFLGNFSHFVGPSEPGIVSSVTATLRSSPSLEVYHTNLGLTYEERHQGDEFIRTWVGDRSVKPIPETERGVTDIALTAPHLAFSSFASYEDLARVYIRAAAPKLQPSAKLQKLSDEITASKEGTLAQTEAIFRWVADNIRYTAIHFGAGRLIPNDLDTVLSRGFGDCKDKAALAIALLQAKGIEAQYALIQTGPSYELPQTAVIEAFNHMVVYVPEIDKYLDPTDPASHVGSLPAELAGKPVVLTSLQEGEAFAKVARTPVGTPNENLSLVTGLLKLTPEGLVGGEAITEAEGEFAHDLRKLAQGAELHGAEWASAALLRGYGAPGSASFNFPSGPQQPIEVKTIWRTQPPYQVPAMWSPQMAVAPGIAAPSQVIFSSEPVERQFKSACRPARMITNTVIELPAGKSVHPVPESVRVTAPNFSYERSWSLANGELSSTVEIVTTFQTRSCDPEAINAITRALAEKRDKIAPRVMLVPQPQPIP